VWGKTKEAMEEEGDNYISSFGGERENEVSTIRWGSGVVRGGECGGGGTPPLIII
jgi:hypothetical protein